MKTRGAAISECKVIHFTITLIPVVAVALAALASRSQGIGEARIRLLMAL
jgi:hypothetical protein